MTIDLSVRKEQLATLERALQSLCELLRLDPRCHWRNHFERCLETTSRLLQSGFDQADLNALSGSVRMVFGGMGSFNDYVPIMNTKASSTWYQAHGNPDKAIGAVYENALALMVIGERHG